MQYVKWRRGPLQAHGSTKLGENGNWITFAGDWRVRGGGERDRDTERERDGLLSNRYPPLLGLKLEAASLTTAPDQRQGHSQRVCVGREGRGA